MSDYMFMLENHLNPHQARVVAAMQSAAAEAGMSLFLSGGAMRDMLGGFPIRDLDFVLEGNLRFLALVGFIPLLTSLVSWCPLYALFGLSTCPAKPARP